MKRWLRVLKWCLLSLLGILGILLTVGAIRTHAAGARLQKELTALRESGAAMSLVDLARPSIPPEENGQTYLARARDALIAIEQELSDAEDGATDEEKTAFSDGVAKGAILNALRTSLAAHPEAMDLADEASRCPDFDFGFDFNADTDSFLEAVLGQARPCRSVIRVATYQVHVQLADGRPEKALETCLMMFRLIKLFDRNPLMISGLICNAVRGVAAFSANQVLQSSPLPSEAHAALEETLAAQDLLANERRMFESERAFGLQYFDELGVNRYTALTMRMLPMFKNDECDYINVMRVAIQEASLPYSQWKVKTEAVLAEQSLGLLTNLVAGSIYDAHTQRLRTQAQLAALRVINALGERQQAGEQGEPNLSDLGLPAEAITDPFNGEPLHVKKLPKGWLVYSVGPGLQDDGGDVYPGSKDIGLGPPAPATSEKPSAQQPIP